MADETLPSGAGDGAIGSARIDVTVNTATMQPGIEAAKRSVSGLGAEASAQFDRANASAKRYAESLLRQTELLGKTKAERIAYDAQMRIGGELGEQIAAKALATQAKLSATIGGTAKSAGELQFALRSLPAQITDIVTGLATGQRPLQVLLQQGGQVKDLFGGIGPGLKAVGTYALGMISPLTLAGSALAAFALAAYQGSEESQELNRSLIATGNYSGETAGKIRSLAVEIGASTGQVGAARDAIVGLVASGAIVHDRLREASQAAVDFANVTGESIDKAVDAFVRLQREPSKAVKDLDEQFHFLTATQYENIKALEAQGEAELAAAVAQTAAAQAFRERAADVQANLGVMDRAWVNLRGHVLEAWDAMKGVGRQSSNADDVTAIDKELDRYRERLAGIRKVAVGSITDADLANAGEIVLSRDRIKELLSQKASASAGALFEEWQAAAEADRQKLVTDAKKSSDVIDGYLKAAKADEARAAEIAKIKKATNALIAEDPSRRAEFEANQAIAIGEVEKRYADRGSVARPPDLSIDYVSLRKEMNEDIEKSIKGYKKEFDQWSKNTVAVEAYRQAISDKIKTEQESVDLQVHAIGMSQRQIDVEQRVIQIRREADHDRLTLERDYANKSRNMSQEQHDEQLRIINDAEEQRIAIVRRGNEAILEEQGKWTLGLKGALADYVDQAANVAGQTRSIFTNAFDGMADSIASFVTTGKLNFRSLATSILADLARIEARILISQALQSIMGSFMGGMGSTGVALSGSGSYTGMGVASDIAGFTFNARGGVYDSPSLSSFSGQIVDRPTLFAFAKGAGVMGEAGPEAIMPLRRGPDGRLGVSSAGGGMTNQVNITVNVDSSGNAESETSEGNDELARQLGGMIDLRVRQMLANEQRPGGILWKMQHG